MHIEIQTVALIGKAFTQRREKKADDTEAVIGHLKFQACRITREIIDEICGQPVGWSQGALYDEFGIPLVWSELVLHKFEAELTGTITGIAASERITISNATLSNVSIAFDDKGGQMSGEIAWEIAGDESSDLMPLQGNDCAVHWVLQDSGQQDFIKQQSAQAA